MRQRRWIELFSDYEQEGMDKTETSRATSMTIHSYIRARILEAQSEASKDINNLAEILRGLDKQFERKDDGGLYFVERIWVSTVGNVRTLIMDKAHVTKYYVHPGADKIFLSYPQGLQDGKKTFGMQLDMSTAYPPQTDGQSEHTIQTLKDMLRLNPGDARDEMLVLMDSAIRIFHSSPFGARVHSTKALRLVSLFMRSSIAITLRDSKPFDTLADLGSCVNLIPLYLFKTLNIGILEETENVTGLADGTKSYPVGIVKNVEDPMCPLLVGRGFLVTASAIIDCKKAKIALGEGITRSIFRVKEIGLGHVDTPYWTTLAKRKSYESRPSTNYIGNMWESENLIDKKIDVKRPPKEGDGVWHIRIEMIDLDG
ncbi:glutathione S-transferase T3-like protein [Tanacetum coccineum]|uniref:Glutathione S-transferase T3-like protein n=1 Tax=Tanacetum coccineum TaxID=301880 RepID=A0ABQ5H367_9ASTR